MDIEEDIVEALGILGLDVGEKQETRPVSLLRAILSIQQDPPVPLKFQDIYDGLMREDPSAKLSKAYVHRVLKSLVDSKMIRVGSPKSRRKKYIADANTLMAGLEYLKSRKTVEIEQAISALKTQLDKMDSLDCGHAAQEMIRGFTGREQEVSSRIVRGVDELHRVLRYNMLEVAEEGDIVRATMLWAGPFIEGSSERTKKFVDAAARGVEVRYLVSTDLFRFDSDPSAPLQKEAFHGIIQQVHQLRAKGLKFDVRLYLGPKTYNQVSLNNQGMVLIVTENPVTATWMTRQFNPDLIDNAVAAFDKDWERATSILEMTPEQIQAMGAKSGGLISEMTKGK
ncbi:hypothetical protein EU546_02075 [Candidatus Thorarchaeota archaeon]|nr:MAG: hypothetical protein EU546_02075 [Candidatus Thorarchaeota archaeon]